MSDTQYETYLNREQERSDAIQKQIMDLITEADSPKDKAYLLLLNQMGESMRTNTSVTIRLARTMENHIERFADHEKMESELINKTKGAWWVLAGVLILGQALGVTLINNSLENDERIEKRLDILEQWQHGHKQHHEVEEKHSKAVLPK